jgi:protein-disulfide isomerase
VYQEEEKSDAAHSVLRLDLRGIPWAGSAGADLGIVELTDYQCSYCSNFFIKVYPQLKKAYIETGVVRYFFMDFPLPFHQEAVPAAIAAQCAGEQQHYMAMKNNLYANQVNLGRKLYLGIARYLKLDEQKFTECLQAAGPKRRILRDIQAGKRIGVSGTPSFALGRIDGDTLLIHRITLGASSLEEFSNEIEGLRKQD